MRYTQSQIRELLSISVDALRTWRAAIPALAAHKGHAPSFTPGDVVAIAIVAELVKDFGVRVGTVGGRFDQLFRECRGKSWLSLESCIALIEADSIRLVDAGKPVRPSRAKSTIGMLGWRRPPKRLTKVSPIHCSIVGLRLSDERQASGNLCRQAR